MKEILTKKEEIKIPEKAQKLKDFCLENGNEIKFIDNQFGENLPCEEIKRNDFDDEKRLLNICKFYLNGPIFTDTFHEDHNKRRNWKTVNAEKLANEGIKQFYGSNRLCINNVSSVVGFLDLLLGDMDITEKKKELQNIKEEIIKNTGDLVNMDKDGYQLYGNLNDAEKIKNINKFSIIVHKLILILESK